MKSLIEWKRNLKVGFLVFAAMFVANLVKAVPTGYYVYELMAANSPVAENAALFAAAFTTLEALPFTFSYGMGFAYALVVLVGMYMTGWLFRIVFRILGKDFLEEAVVKS